MRLTRETKFDVKTHKENFTKYLEVVILNDGTVEYAVPSHINKLAEKYCEIHNISQEELYEIIPLTDLPIDWLVYNLKAISVWNSFIIRPKDITKEQEEALKMLVDNDLLDKNYSESVLYINEYENLVYKRG